MATQMVNVRCPKKVIELLDTVGEIYGLSRSELLRAGGIAYCQQLMATDSLREILSACYDVSSKAHKGTLQEAELDAMENLLNALQGQLGLK